MDDLVARDHVRRHGEKSFGQMLDQGAAEKPVYQMIDASTSGERYRGDRVVAKRVALCNELSCRGGCIPGVHSQRERRSGDRTGTSPAEPVDDDAGPGELFVD